MCSQLSKHLQVSIAFENHKAQWLDTLKGSPVDIIVIDGNVRLPAANHWFWTPQSGVDCVISRHPLRRGVPKGWKCVRKSLQHVELGGVTDWKGSFLVFRRVMSGDDSLFWQDNLFSSVPGEFNHLILDPMASGSLSPPPARDDYNSAVSTFPLQAWVDSGTLVSRRTRFRLPNRCSPTGYVRRPLTPDEGLKIFDLPAGITQNLSPDARRLLATSLDVPLKVISPVAACLGHWIAEQTGAGGGVFVYLQTICGNGRGNRSVSSVS